MDRIAAGRTLSGWSIRSPPTQFEYSNLDNGPTARMSELILDAWNDAVRTHQKTGPSPCPLLLSLPDGIFLSRSYVVVPVPAGGDGCRALWRDASARPDDAAVPARTRTPGSRVSASIVGLAVLVKIPVGNGMSGYTVRLQHVLFFRAMYTELHRHDHVDHEIAATWGRKYGPKAVRRSGWWDLGRFTNSGTASPSAPSASSRIARRGHSER